VLSPGFAWLKDDRSLSLAATVAKERPGTKRVEGGSGSPARPLLTRIRHTSSPSYSRVIVELTEAVRYETHRLREDRTKGLPPRIYVDLLGVRLAVDAIDPILVQDGLLRQVRVGQFSPDVVRVVLDVGSLVSHKAVLLADPYRLVIDVQGQENGGEPAAVEKRRGPAPEGEGNKSQGGRIRKIVLDPGHGGRDPGAIGLRGVAEKDIVLSIAKKLSRKLEREMGVQVVLTRRNDSFVPLEDRTATANAENADLFISLHTNASPNREARGIETYYLDNTTDEASVRLAARENATSRRNISDLQFILSDLTQNSKLEDSISLAHHLHASLVSQVSERYGGVTDLGVKKALFYVLVGARMPSVLAEIFFITNKQEWRQLTSQATQKTIVDALYEGIKKYRDSTLIVKNL
jgi:N-acetylmuramoyl-L-alanine amidase